MTDKLIRNPIKTSLVGAVYFMRKAKKQQLVLKKGVEKYIFRYDSGSEDKLIDAVIKQAEDGRTSFDWFAVLSFKLTQSLLKEADEILYDKIPACAESMGDECLEI